MTQPQPPEATLIQNAAAGGADAFEDLIKPYLAMFHNAIFLILGDHADTQDALQEALLAIYKGLPKFEGRSAFSSWGYRICINSALMLRRTRIRLAEESLGDPGGSGGSDDPPANPEVLKECLTQPDAHDKVEQAQLKALLMEALDRLPDAQREVFILRDIEDWDTEEVAKHLGISSLLVRQRLHRARDFLFSRLRRQLLGRA